MSAQEPIAASALPGLMQLAVDAARSAQKLILSGFRSSTLHAQKKPDGSPVTRFDREAEQCIRQFLAAHAPQEWPVLGEELGDDSAGARYRWVVDPIDGTLGYSRGTPMFGTLVALEEVALERALVGVIHLPALGETYCAARGFGAWCDAERLQVAPARELHDCLICAPPETQFRLGGSADSHAQLRAQAPHLRSYSDCWAHAMVARGALDALAEFNLARWDIAATQVLVEEAGGVFQVRAARDVRGKYDLLIGSPGAAADMARLLQFGS